MLCSVAHLIGNTSVEVNEDYVEGVVIYSALIANPATGKSSGMNIFKKALEEVEEMDDIPVEESKLVNGI